MDAEQLFQTKRFGLIIRTLASKPELVTTQVKAVKETVLLALGIYEGPRKIFSRVDVLVSADDSRQDSDC